MNPVIEYDKSGKPTIKRAETFCSVLDSKLPASHTSIKALFDSIDEQIISQHPKVKKEALNNCHGDWYEWIIGASAWNFRIDNDKSYLLLSIPNIKQFDVAALYKKELFDYIADLRNKVFKAADVELITSNPDFVIINSQNFNFGSDFNNKFEKIDDKAVNKLQTAYSFFTNLCGFEDIVGYLSVKTSLRPDRRLQISHEGSLMKATYVHLQTRDWIINPAGLKYYAASTEIGEADRKALKTVATHSITNVQSVPQAAVDDVFKIDSINEAYDAFEKIIL